MSLLAGWQSGYAAACKAVYLGSIPGPASKYLNKNQIVRCLLECRTNLQSNSFSTKMNAWITKALEGSRSREIEAFHCILIGHPS